MLHAALGLLLLAVAAACGPKPGPGGGSATAVLPDVPFEQLDHDQKIQFMKQVVLPLMGPMFERHDAEKYAKFGCKTCHGPGADRGLYHMPNDKLPKLNLTDMSKYQQADIVFMKSEVKPTMAKLLKVPEHSEENRDGFGCLSCHASATN
jgi:hypothetical protein